MRQTGVRSGKHYIVWKVKCKGMFTARILMSDTILMLAKALHDPDGYLYYRIEIRSRRGLLRRRYWWNLIRISNGQNVATSTGGRGAHSSKEVVEEVARALARATGWELVDLTLKGD
jgi:hypothetical protein